MDTVSTSTADNLNARRALMANTLALVLAGGRGTRLEGLTAQRAKPAVPIGGRHRIIDFTLSNCLNSGLACVGVLTQYMAQSLVPHLAAWSHRSRAMELLALPAGASRAYAGTADAVHQNRELVRRLAPAQVLVLAADHVYRMDYARMLEAHLRRRAQMTVGRVEVPVESARSFGVMAIDDAGWIAGFAEKPDSPRAIPGRPGVALVSMGIYLFETDFLLRLLRNDALRPHSARDFGRNVIPDALAGTTRAYAHRLRDVHDPWRDGYWRDVGTVDAYWQTSLELCGDNPPWRLDDPHWPVHGLSIGAPADRSAAPAHDDDGVADVRRSVLFPGVRVGSGARLDGCIALPGAQIDRGCRVRNAIIDEGCHLPPGTEIGVDIDADRRRYPVTPNGVVLVARQPAEAAGI